MKSPFRVGATVYLRPLEPEDAARTVVWINNPDVSRTLAVWRPMRLADEIAFIDRTSKSPDELVLGIALVADDRLVGVTGFHQIDSKNRGANFGIAIGQPTDWDKGYGTEATRLMTDLAFESMNLNRVMLHVYEHNERGIRSYEKVGFKREGVLRQHHFWGGAYKDTIVMGLLRQDWDEARKG